MEEKKISDKDFAIECITAMYERSIKRLWILCIIILIICAGSNFGWFYYNSQYETIKETEVTQENEQGNNNYIGNDGDITNGEADN